MHYIIHLGLTCLSTRPAPHNNKLPGIILNGHFAGFLQCFSSIPTPQSALVTVIHSHPFDAFDSRAAQVRKKRLYFHISGQTCYLLKHGGPMMHPKGQMPTSSSRFLAIIHHRNSGTEGQVRTIFHFCSDTESVTPTTHLETMTTVYVTVVAKNTEKGLAPCADTNKAEQDVV